MNKVNIENLEKYYSAEQWKRECITIADQKDEKSPVNIMMDFQGCRGYFSDIVFKYKNPEIKKYSPTYDFDYNIKTGHTLFAYILRTETVLDNVKKNLEKFLHPREEKAGVTLTEIFTTQNPEVFLLKGDLVWKQSCWTMMLYSYYLRCLREVTPTANVDFYGNKLFPVEDIFLQKVGKVEEVFDPKVYGLPYNEMHSRGYIHSNTGFFAIATGCNPPMAKLIGIPDHYV